MKDMKLTASDMALTADTAKRTITGFAFTTDVDWEYDGEVCRFASPDAVTPWREHLPLCYQHDINNPVGRVIDSERTDNGWKLTFKVSATPQGDQMLTLASDGVLGGLSMYLRDVQGEPSEGRTMVTSAKCTEISLVTHPAVPSALLTGVALSAIPNTVEKETTMPDTPETNVEATTELELSAQPVGPTIHPVPLIGVAREEAPYPHLFGGRSNGNSFFKDLRLSANGGQGAIEASERIMKLAVTSDDMPPRDATDSGIRVEARDPRNPLSGIITSKGLTGDGPFYVLHRDNTGDTNLSNPHVEGVEPALGDIGSWSRATVEPGAVSGKVAVTREAFLADTSPDAESLVFARMDVARNRAIEVNAATKLAALTLPAGQVKTLGGTNVDDELTAVQLDLLYSEDGDRYTVAVVGRELFGDIVNLKDSTGRPKYPILGASNANGTTAANLRSVNVNGMTIYPLRGIGTGGYLLDPTSVISWLGTVQNFTFDYEVAWVRLGHFQYQAFDVVDSTGVVRLTRAA